MVLSLDNWLGGNWYPNGFVVTSRALIRYNIYIF